MHARRSVHGAGRHVSDAAPKIQKDFVDVHVHILFYYRHSDGHLCRLVPVLKRFKKHFFQAGAHWLTLFDAYGASGIALLFVVFFEVVGLAWGFGANRVSQALKKMLGFHPNPAIKIFWKYTAPLVTAVLFVALVLLYQPLKYPNGESYPMWAEIFGLMLSACSIVVIPGYALFYMFCRPEGVSCKEVFYR